MIGYLKGKILERPSAGAILIGVGEVSLIGYAVICPQNLHYQSRIEGSEIEFFIHTHVREDALDLYGFSSRAEKSLFLLLMTVSGVGPKLALNILSHCEPEKLIRIL